MSKEDLIKGLIDNQMGVQRNDDLSRLFGFRWVPAPEWSKCPHCDGPLERTVGLTLASPWAGSVRCTLCPYKNSVMGYLGSEIIKVERMPQGATLTYDRDPGVIDAIMDGGDPE